MNNFSNPKKSLGQHFLYDQNIINKIICSAQIDQNDHILEIGSGRGHLTEALINTGAKIVSLEIDDDLYAHGLQRFAEAANFQILHIDAINFNPSDFFDKPFKLIANLPYNLGSRLLRKFLFSEPHSDISVVMLQREVAMNIVASPNKMNILSSTFQTVAETELLFNVKPTSFLPPPKVYSSVIKLIFKDHPLVEKSELDDFFNFVVAAFAAPRKQIKNSLSLGLRIDSSAIEKILTTIEVLPTRRPQTFTIFEWKLLFDSFKTVVI
tara:strand:- start:558 stop:1358 length:801 start_codon:yes stop_codon:yes gene_type:complete